LPIQIRKGLLEPVWFCGLFLLQVKSGTGWLLLLHLLLLLLLLA
jgi:hypothetical protein